MNDPRIDLDYLQRWARREPVILTEMLDLRPALNLATMLDRTDTPRMGDISPLLWQWGYFTPAPLASTVTRNAVVFYPRYHCSGACSPPAISGSIPRCA